ncbi:MAG: YraN family protein [Eggerthellaceae bacterium]
MSNFELQDKAIKAATCFIERKGFELLEAGWTSPEGTQINLIASDEDSLVFIDVVATEYGDGGFESGKVKRSDLEIAAASWLAGNCPDGDIQVRFDIIDMLVVSADRALLRHHINASSCGVE